MELTTRILLDLLDRVNVRATVFVVGWVAERHPQLVAAVRDAGHEIGSHGHLHQRAYELGPEAFRADLHTSLRALSAIGVPPITMFRAPEWSVNDRSPWALDALVAQGIKTDASMAPLTMVGSLSYPRYPHIRNTRLGPITEVPPLVADRLGFVMPMGWGWGLRMSSPFRVLRTIETLNRRGLPAVLAVHPWELDPDPPRIRLPVRLQFAHYFRLSGFGERLRQVLEGATFGRIGDMAPVSAPP